MEIGETVSTETLTPTVITWTGAVSSLSRTICFTGTIDKDMKNISLSCSNSEVVGIVIKKITDDCMDIVLYFSGSLTSGGSHSVTINATIIPQDTNEHEGLANQLNPLLKGPHEVITRAIGGILTPAKTHRIHNVRSIKPVDEHEDNRIETIQEDLDLVDEFGVLS